MSEPGALMAAEIAEQPQILERLRVDGLAQAAEIRRAIHEFAPRMVIFAARGTSDHAALYAKYLVEVRRQLPAALASPSSLTVYHSRPDLRQALFVAVSQSGGSPDLIESVEVARGCGALTLAVTNAPESALVKAAEHHLDVRAGLEQAVAATKTYTAEMMALAMLFGGGDDALVPDVSALPEAAARTLAMADRPYAAAQRYRFAQRLVTTARGYSYPTAREAALKVMETSYLSAQAFSGADLLHGPLAMVDGQLPVIAVVSPGAGGDAMVPVLERIEEAGADVLRVGPADGLPVVTDGVAEELFPVLEILPLQQLAWRLSLDRRQDPDRPRGLLKVTQTR
ncbi:SIS domain-containing protein [Leekyejoonella antrihumi]|nr:SIS domain-containing protein [Leekyejoonella antrihumi]